MRGVIPLFPLYTFMLWEGSALSFILIMRVLFPYSSGNEYDVIVFRCFGGFFRFHLRGSARSVKRNEESGSCSIQSTGMLGCSIRMH
jgi:hypothetical protein